MRNVLLAAGVYNLVWGGLVVLFPAMTLAWTGLPSGGNLALWQCIGMIVGVYGVGYAIAARDPLRHWPIVLVGLLGKVFGPIGAVLGYLRGELPAQLLLTNVTNDFIWWIPFTMILYAAAKSALAPPADGAEAPLSIEQALATYRDQHSTPLDELSRRTPLLVVFLRHAGCTFCREALADLSRQRAQIASAGATITLVHMDANDADAARYFGGYGLSDVPRVSDPDCRLYRAFGLVRGSWWQLFGLPVWWPGLKAILSGHSIGRMVGDGFQMPGAFLVERGQITRAYRHAFSADRPDYCELAAPAKAEAGAATEKTEAMASDARLRP